MTKALIILPIASALFFVFLGGCSQTKLGKVDLSSGTTPNFLEMGKTTVEEVLIQIGEPFGYKERKNRSAIIYLNFNEDYVNLLFTEIRIEKAYRLDLVFQNDILQKAEIKKEGWGFGANIDPQLLQLLAR